MIDFLDFFFGLGGVGEVEKALSEFGEGIDEDDIEATMDEVSRLTLEELSYIQTRIMKEYFYLNGTAIYKAYSNFFSEDLCPLVDDWQQGFYEIDSSDQQDYINELFKIADGYAVC